MIFFIFFIIILHIERPALGHAENKLNHKEHFSEIHSLPRPFSLNQ